MKRFMNKWFSTMFAVAIFAGLSCYASTVNAQVPLASEETRLLIEDSQNAHQVAKLTLDTVSCIMTALEQEVDWTPAQCLAELRKRLGPLGLEHQLLHPKVVRMIEQKLVTKVS